ncbi:MAG: hypothetical protein UC390_11360 [Peptococcaceae bacterium]|nr:hypothetical protein [Peptococcaceae bacterium]
MESELVQAIQEIAQELNQTTCFDILSLIISFISAIATVSVLWYNHKTIKLAKENMQHSQDLAFYEKMLVVANNIAQEDYSNTDIEIKLLFGKDVLESIQKIRALKLKIENIDKAREKSIKSFCKQLDRNEINVLLGNDDKVSPEMFLDFENLEEDFRVVYSEDGEEYTWQTISKKQSEVTQELESLVQKVNDDIRNIMEEKFSL